MFLKHFSIFSLGIMGHLFAHPGHDHAAPESNLVHMILASGAIVLIGACVTFLKKKSLWKGRIF